MRMGANFTFNLFFLISLLAIRILILKTGDPSKITVDFSRAEATKQRNGSKTQNF